MSNETQPPFTQRGVRLSWSAVWQLLVMLSPFILFLIVAYMSTIFARHEDIQPLATLPARVDKLEEFKSEQKLQQNASNAAIGAVQQDLSGLKAQLRALQDESTRNTDRILSRLDRMSQAK